MLEFYAYIDIVVVNAFVKKNISLYLCASTDVY